MRFKDLLGKDASEWIVQYDILGWTVHNYENNSFNIVISEKVAMKMIKMIRNSLVKPYNDIP
jgi:hypothetical protein